MVLKNGAFRSSAATARFVLLLLLVLLLLGVGKGNSVSADPWRLPCGTTAPSSADLARVMLSLQQRAAETEGAARLLQRFLTCDSPYNCLSRSGPEIHYHVAETLSEQQANKLSMQHVAVHTEGAARVVQHVVRRGRNPRLSSLQVSTIQSHRLVDFVDNSTHNVCQTLIAYRIHLSKAFLFLKESAKFRQQYCRESRPDRGEAMTLTRAVLHRIQLTLCNLDTYLSCSGHPMPSHLVPDHNVLLQTSRASRHVLCQYAFYNDRAYVVARETIDMVGRLSERLSALSSASD